MAPVLTPQTPKDCQKRAQLLQKLVDEFVVEARGNVETIVKELPLPVAKKTIVPMNEKAGFMGGAKYIHVRTRSLSHGREEAPVHACLCTLHEACAICSNCGNICCYYCCHSPSPSPQNGLFYKFAMDHHSFFGSEDAAGKVAGHELAAFNELVACQVNQLHVPLISLFTYGGYRVIVTCILPIDEQTLQFGSADGGRTIKGLPFVPPFDVDTALRQPIPLGMRSCTPHTKAISELLRKVCEKLNLKPHGGMERSTDQVKLMFGPTDMEVHRGRDGRYYIIGTEVCALERSLIPRAFRHQPSISA